MVLLLAPASDAATQQLVPPAPQAPYRLREAGYFGSVDFVPAAGTDSLTRRAGGDIFGRVNDIAFSPDRRTLYVLDAVGRKVVALGEQGIPQVVFTWRNGRGPGEFTRARGFAVTTNGFVIGDMGDPRLSFFAPDGKFQKNVPLNGSMLGMIATEDGLAVSRMVVREGSYQILMLDPAGLVQDSMIPLQGRLRDFTPFGESGILFMDGAGKPWHASPAPGMVCTVARPSRCNGIDLFPGVKGYINERGARGVPLGVRGVAQLGTGETVILIRIDGEEARNWLLLFDRQMKYVGYVNAGTDHAHKIARGFGANEILLAQDEPYPRVIRYVVERSRGGAPVRRD